MACVLADHALAQLVLHVQQLLALALEHPVDRNAGPARHHLGDLLGSHLLLEHLVRLASEASASLRSERRE